MKKITKEDVDKLAHLARLDFSDKEKTTMMQDMDKILGFVDKISELDLEGVEPLIYMSEERNVLRKDVAKSVVTKDEALKNAPDKDTDFFRVPKVLNREES
jgi:aspartyl-tRNA(Asn)/glutamyl-tRNA(Gln) amidotransferase subunit C